MPTPDESRTARVGLFMALAAFLQAAETLFPTPVPWFRLGLGNALVLAALYLWDVREGVWVAIGKVLVGALVTGRLLSPGFFLAAGGTAASTAVMALLLHHHLAGKLPLGFVGVSVAGAAAHAFTQLLLAQIVFIKTPAIWSLAPVVGSAAVISGIITGLGAAYLSKVVSSTSTNLSSESNARL